MIQKKDFKGAILRNDIILVKSLLEDNSVDFSDYKEAFCYASKNGYVDIVKLFLSDEKKIHSFHYNDVIRYATGNGHTEIIELLLNDKRIQEGERQDAFRYSCQHGNVTICKLLLNDNTMNPSCHNNWAIRHASQNGHIEIIKLLLKDERIQISEGCSEAILIANNTDITKLLWDYIRIKEGLKIYNPSLYNTLTTEEIQNKVSEF